MNVADEVKSERVVFDDDPALLARVMRVYLPHCRYLTGAVLEATPEPGGPARPTVTGRFAIGDSCYIDDTGHFNAVEFNICYNQMAYYLIAKAVKEGLLPVFAGWQLEDFFRLQLPNILITDFHSTFKRQMRGERFSGSVTITEVLKLERSERWDELVVLRTVCRFWDETGGSCRGEVKLAITNPVP
jgi:FcoT-like thioesterase domain